MTRPDKNKLHDLLLSASSDRLAEWLENSSFTFWFADILRNLEAETVGIRPLEKYLSRFPDRLTRLKIKSQLTKAVRFGDARSEQEYIETVTSDPSSRLNYSSLIGKKKNGMRLLQKPTWHLMNGAGSGYGISKVGAEYANWLYGNRYSLKEMQVGPDVAYEKQRHEIARWTIRNPTVSARDPDISRKDYPGVFRDSGHGIPNVDDPYPGEPCPAGALCPDTVEEVRLSDEIGKLIDLRKDYQHDLDDMLSKLKKSITPDAVIKGRVKTPFSILNKLRRKRITGEHGLTDVAGAMIVAPDYAGVKQAVSTVERIYPVVSREDYYERPLSGYRAYHLIVALPGDRRAEVQIKSRRMAEISHASHTPYKEERLNAAEMNRLTALADRADRGDRTAAREIDGILARGEPAVERMLTLSHQA